MQIVQRMVSQHSCLRNGGVRGMHFARQYQHLQASVHLLRCLQYRAGDAQNHRTGNAEGVSWAGIDGCTLEWSGQLSLGTCGSKRAGDRSSEHHSHAFQDEPTARVSPFLNTRRPLFVFYRDRCHSSQVGVHYLGPCRGQIDPPLPPGTQGSAPINPSPKEKPVGKSQINAEGRRWRM